MMTPETNQIARLTLYVPEIALMLGVGRDHAKTLISNGTLRNIGTLRKFAVSKSEVLRYIEGK